MKYSSADDIYTALAEELAVFLTEASTVYLVNDSSVCHSIYKNVLKDLKAPIVSVEPNQICKFSDKMGVLIVPEFSYRVFNINYDVGLGRSIGAPYWVHISTRKIDRLRSILKTSFGEVVINPLSDFPAVLKAYLKSKVFLDWLCDDGNPDRHNDRIDRILTSEIFESKNLSKLYSENQQSPLGHCNLQEFFVGYYDIDDG